MGAARQAAVRAVTKNCPGSVAFETIFQRAAAAQSLSFEPTKSLNRCRISFTIAPMHQPALVVRIWLTDICEQTSNWETSHDNGVYAPETRGAGDAFRRRHGGSGARGDSTATRQWRGPADP